MLLRVFVGVRCCGLFCNVAFVVVCCWLLAVFWLSLVACCRLLGDCLFLLFVDCMLLAFVVVDACM